MKADLHIHSVYSDGTDTPAQIAEAAKNKGLEVVSLTDHDTADGIPEMAVQAQKQGLKFIPGIELSSLINIEIHILGYNVDICNPKFVFELARLKELRIKRLEKMLNKLKSAGIKVTQSDVMECASSKNVPGRMHVAKALVRAGYADCIQETFDRWLGFGKTAYVPSNRLKPSEAIRIILSAGGKPVLAHPSLIDIEPQNFLSLLKEMVKHGLKGIEAQYSAHTTGENKYYQEIAAKYGLIQTCGSDYHGKSRPGEINGYELAPQDYVGLIS